jgi:hypothetical protein
MVILGLTYIKIIFLTYIQSFETLKILKNIYLIFIKQKKIYVVIERFELTTS